MNVVFMGTPDFAAGILEAVIKAGHHVQAVITGEDKPAGRGRRLQATPVKMAAEKAGIPALQPLSVKTDEVYGALVSFGPDMIIVAAYGKIIPKRILDLPRYGCINVHASLLPAYRGAAPIQWAVIDGQKTSGVTIMRMNEGLDTGDMLAKCEVELSPEETGGSLFDRLAKAGAELLVRTMDRIAAGDIIPEPQPEKSTTQYARMIRKEDGRIDWTKDAASIERLIRGLDPWPSAFTRLDGKTLKIWKAEVLTEEEQTVSPGQVFGVDKCGFCVMTGSGALRILELQAEGKRRMRAEEFLRGHSMENGLQL